MPVEILVTVRRIKIYYLSDSHPQIVRIYFFWGPRSSGLAEDCNLYTKQVESVESSVLEKRETSIAKARAWVSRAEWDWVLKRNQYGEWRRSRHSGRRVSLNWTQSNIIRLKELRFHLHRFFNLFVNAWPHLWHKKIHGFGMVGVVKIQGTCLVRYA